MVEIAGAGSGNRTRVFSLEGFQNLQRFLYGRVTLFLSRSSPNEDAGHDLFTAPYKGSMMFNRYLPQAILCAVLLVAVVGYEAWKLLAG